ncbi:MAG: hypothetical protein ABIN17_07710 [candidate division WOR-3 bacterium]
MKKFKEFKKKFIQYELIKFFINFISFLFFLIPILFLSGLKFLIILPLLAFYFPLKIITRKDAFYALKLEKLTVGFDGKIISALLYSKSENKFERSYSEYIFNKLDQIEIDKVLKKNYKREIKIFILSFFILIFSYFLFTDRFIKFFFNIPEIKEKIIYKNPPEFHYITQPFVYTVKILGKDIKDAYVIYKYKGKIKKEKINVYKNSIVFTFKPEPGLFEFKFKTKNDETPFLKTKFIEPPRIIKIEVFEGNKLLNLPMVKIKENKKLDFFINLSDPVDSEEIILGERKIVLKNVKDYNFSNIFKNSSKIKFIHFVKNDSFQDPQTVLVSIIRELKPIIQIIFPDFDVNIPDEMKIPFTLYVSDDIGLDRVNVYVEKDGKTILEKIIKKYVNTKNDTFTFDLDFDPLNPKPGDNFYVFFRVYDKDEVKKFSDSRKVLVHMPTFEELYEEVKRESEKFEEELKPLRSEAKDLIKKIKEVREKIMESLTKKELKKEIEEIQRISEELTKKLEEVERKMKNLEENIVSIDPEINEKLSKLTELVKELFSEELKELYKKLEEAVEKGNKEEIEKRLKELMKEKEIWKENLERTISLLEKIKKEYDLKKLVEKAKEIEKEFFEIMKNKEGKNMEESQKKLEDIIKEMEKIKENYDKNVNSKIDTAQKKGEMALKELKENNLKGSFKNTSEMRENLEKAMEEFMKSNLEFSMKLIEKAFWGVMGFIKESESLDRDFLISYKNFVSDIILNARNTLLFPREALREIKISEFLMDEYINKKENNEFNQAQKNLKDLRSSLSKAAYFLLQFSDKISSSGGSESELFENMMQKISEMIKKQGDINSATLSLLPLPQPTQLSQEEKELLSQLAKEQGELVEEISKLIKELEEKGEKSGIKGALEGAEKEMKESEEKLRKEELTERLKDIQERIISRLLQAQRSIRKREFIKRRYAERPKPYEVTSPNKIDISEYLKILEGKKEILKNKNLVSPYKEVILKYYEKLEKFENR